MDFFQTLVNTSVELCYRGNHLKLARKRKEWEFDNIVKYNFADYYITAYWMYKNITEQSSINVWARGSMCSSVICYALGLTAVDPIRFNLHSERFVNDEAPNFQFDIEASRMQDFKDEMKTILEEDDDYFGLPPMVRNLLKETTPMPYLGNRRKKRIPLNLDEDMICYTLSFPQLLSLRDVYEDRQKGYEVYGYEPLDSILSSTRGLLVYQEQMLDILETIFEVPYLEANGIRKAIMRGEREKVAAYKERFVRPGNSMTEKAWSVLISNPYAFLKSHAVSRVMASHYYGAKI